LEGIVDGAKVGEIVNLGDEGESAYGHKLDQIGGHGLVSSALDGREGVSQVFSEFRGVLVELGALCDCWGFRSRHDGRKMQGAMRPTSGYSIDPPERRIGAVLWLLSRKFALAVVTSF
jgi:hypothetical protein